MPSHCPFCHPDSARVFHEGNLTLALWDPHPVSEGHALLVTRRHVATWFDATNAELAELVAGIEIARARIIESHAPDGFNIGVNAGEAAGQTVMHLHMHVIPRYAGDVADPRGGVRHVIPARGNYLLQSTPAATPPLRTAEATAPYLDAVSEALFGLAPHRQSLVTGGDADPLLPHLLAHMNRTDALDVAVAFVMGRGVEEVGRHLVDLLERGGRVRVLTGDYLGATDPDALVRLCDLAEEYPGLLEVRVYEARARSFHPKTYILRRGARGPMATGRGWPCSPRHYRRDAMLGAQAGGWAVPVRRLARLVAPDTPVRRLPERRARWGVCATLDAWTTVCEMRKRAGSREPR